MSIAMEWSTRIMTIAVEMAIPAAGGYWLDRRIHTLPLFVLLGAVLGISVGMYHLWQIAREQGPQKHQ